MKIQFGREKALHKACSTDPSRPVLHNVHVAEEADGHIAVATDGRLLIRQSVCVDLEDGETFAPVNIPKHIWEEAWKGRVQSVEVKDGKASTLTKKGHVSMDCDEAQFPNWRQVLHPTDWKPAVWVGIAADSLKKFSEATCQKNLLLEMDFRDGPMRMETDLIMPLARSQRLDVVEYLKTALPSEREAALEYLKAMMEPKQEERTV